MRCILDNKIGLQKSPSTVTMKLMIRNLDTALNLKFKLSKLLSNYIPGASIDEHDCESDGE